MGHVYEAQLTKSLTSRGWKTYFCGRGGDPHVHDALFGSGPQLQKAILVGLLNETSHALAQPQNLFLQFL